MKFKYVVILGYLLCTAITVKSEDSIPLNQLDEVFVFGERTWIEDSIINFIPTKSEKRLSNSPASLIESMHLPFVNAKDGNIVGISGETIPIFINGRRADSIDISTFWSKNVSRVQYLQNPTDPCYGGVTVAVNFLLCRNIKRGELQKWDIFKEFRIMEVRRQQQNWFTKK